MMSKVPLLCTLLPNWILETVLGEVEKDRFITFPGKEGHSGLTALKTVCPNLGRIVISFALTIQRWCD